MLDSGSKTFYILFGAGVAFIIIGVASAVYSLTPVDVPLDGTIPAGHSDRLTPLMNAGNTGSITVTGSTFDVVVTDPDKDVVKAQNDTSSFSYDLVARKNGQYVIDINNTGSSELVITGHAQTKADPIAFGGQLMLVITGVIVAGISLRFRKH